MAAVAHADPLVVEPAMGRARWGEPEGASLGLLVEMRAVGVLTADRLTAWPDRRFGLEPGMPSLIAGRAGLLALFPDLDLTLVARVDGAEAARPRVDDRPLALADALVDDLHLRWAPSSFARLTLGRMRVPWSRPRQLEAADEPFGAAPFIIDRIAPDRRWGAAVDGDLGALAYVGGAWEDLDVLEPRDRLARPGDPSSAGAVAFALHIEWTPRAPLGGASPLPTPRSDPWFDTARVSAGTGAIARVRRDGEKRLDGTLSAQLKWRALGALVEVVASSEGGKLELGGHAEAAVTPVDRLAFALRAEWDPGATPAGASPEPAKTGAWASAAVITWHVTRDRRNRVSVVGWLRRERERGTPFDGLVVFLQASL